jgi:hypothetical protein
MSKVNRGGIVLTKKTENRKPKRNCPSSTFSISHPRWTNQCANPGLAVERPATNQLFVTVTGCFL